MPPNSSALPARSCFRNGRRNTPPNSIIKAPGGVLHLEVISPERGYSVRATAMEVTSKAIIVEVPADARLRSATIVRCEVAVNTKGDIPTTLEIFAQVIRCSSWREGIKLVLRLLVSPTRGEVDFIESVLSAGRKGGPIPLTVSRGADKQMDEWLRCIRGNANNGPKLCVATTNVLCDPFLGNSQIVELLKSYAYLSREPDALAFSSVYLEQVKPVLAKNCAQGRPVTCARTIWAGGITTFAKVDSLHEHVNKKNDTRNKFIRRLRNLQSGKGDFSKIGHVPLQSALPIVWVAPTRLVAEYLGPNPSTAEVSNLVVALGFPRPQGELMVRLEFETPTQVFIPTAADGALNEFFRVLDDGREAEFAESGKTRNNQIGGEAFAEAVVEPLEMSKLQGLELWELK